MVDKERKRKKFGWRSAAAQRLLAMAGQPADMSEAVRKVAGHFLESVECPPTNLEKLQNRLKIASIEVEDLPFSGELRRGDFGFSIILSKHLSPNRRRFTIAHELAHAILETTGPRCPRFGSELERICDMLATELLMPRHTFASRLSPDFSIKHIWEMSRVFKTSLTSTAIRIAELRPWTIFETEGTQVSLGYGIVRKGPIRTMRDDLGPAVRRALECDRGEEHLYLSNAKWKGDWKLEWARMGGSDRTLFLLRPESGSRALNTPPFPVAADTESSVGTSQSSGVAARR